MKSVMMAFVLLGFAQFAAAEDSVDCRTVRVALTDDSKINVSGLDEGDKLHRLQIVQEGSEKYVDIENDQTVLGPARLETVSVTIDNGTSNKVVIIIDWLQFEDGARVPATVLSEDQNGDTELRARTWCEASQS